jgi:hypothetical protein
MATPKAAMLTEDEARIEMIPLFAVVKRIT